MAAASATCPPRSPPTGASSPSSSTAPAAFSGEPRTAFEIIADIVGTENLNPATAAWGLQLARAYIDHLVAAGELVELEGADPRRWQRA